MRKILMGFIGLVMAVAVVAGTGYALFSSTVRANNVAITAGNANLEFSPDHVIWSQDYAYQAWAAQNVYPGFHDCAPFWVRNDSSSPISLDLSAQLVSATGNWDVFADLLQIYVGITGSVTPAYTPTQWDEGGPLGITLAQNSEQSMQVCMTVPTSADNAIANQWISTNWVITGTQHQ